MSDLELLAARLAAQRRSAQAARDVPAVLDGSGVPVAGRLLRAGQLEAATSAVVDGVVSVPGLERSALLVAWFARLVDVAVSDEQAPQGQGAVAVSVRSLREQIAGCDKPEDADSASGLVLMVGRPVVVAAVERLLTAADGDLSAKGDRLRHLAEVLLAVAVSLPEPEPAPPVAGYVEVD